MSRFQIVPVVAVLLIASAQAHAVPGDLDPSFDGDGIAKANVRIDVRTSWAIGVLLEDDGKIIAVGSNASLVRFNADGSIDTTFGQQGGVQMLSAGVTTLARQPDGRIVTAGHLNVSGHTHLALARYNSDGSIDTSFGTAGVVVTPFGSQPIQPEDIALQSDGKIVVAGWTDVSGGRDFAVLRYNTNGSLDATFGTGGIVTTAFVVGSNIERAYAIAVQSDGKIIAAGEVNGSGRWEFGLARYNADGSLDSSFDGDGIVTTAIGAVGDTLSDLLVQADGKIVAVGTAADAPPFPTAAEDFALVRYNPDGSLDTDFDSDGIVRSDFGNQHENARAAVLQPDDKIVVVGHSDHTLFTVARYNPDGSLDASFNDDGFSSIAIGTISSDAIAVALQSDGKVVAVGETLPDFTGEHFALVRYETDGSLDSSFDTDGVLTYAVGQSQDAAQALAVQADGKIVSAGTARADELFGLPEMHFAVVRHNPDGSLDTSFGQQGRVNTPIGPGPEFLSLAYAVTVQSDGKIVVAGMDGSDDWQCMIVRYNSDGSLDTSFGSNGMVGTVGPGGCEFYTVATQNDGKIVAAGTSSSGFIVVRYLPDGSLDATFGTAGIAVTSIGSTASDLAIQPDGKIVVAFDGMPGADRIGVARLNSNGTLDSTFDGDGQVITHLGGTSESTANAVVLQPDGKIVVGGWRRISSSFDFALVRYNANGSLDTTFDADGIVTTNVIGTNEAVRDLILQPNGKLVAAGGGGNPGMGLVRYRADGSLDTTFGVGGKVVRATAAAPTALALQSDGKLVTASTETDDFAVTRFIGMECDATDGVLEAGEECDLGNAVNGAPTSCCTAFCTYQIAATTCRAGSGDVCDVAEACTGSGSTCPPDDASGNAGAVCRAGSGDLCDLAEICTGSPGATCPPDDAPVNTGLVCRSGSGDSCDANETCSGTPGAPCPVDDAPSNTGVLCRSGSGDSCDAHESCTGAPGAPCPSDDAAANAGLLCRSGSGDLCDVNETCTGSAGAPCPSDDAPGNTGLLCRSGSGDSCDANEACSGTPGAPCPTDDAPSNAGVVCRSGSGDSCDADETCTGIPGGSCPANDAPANTGLLCRSGSGDLCDPDENCSGVAGATCPPDAFADGNVECRAADGSCDASEVCPGTAGLGCPSDSVKPDGTSCSDGLYCDGAEVCQSGTCEDGAEPCAGACDEGSAACLSCPTAASAACADAGRHTLRIRRNVNPDRDKLSWKWAIGDSISQTQLADPRTTGTYSLCIYEGSESTLATQLVLSPDNQRWSALGANEDAGFKYRDRDASVAGVTNVLLRTSDRNRARAQVTGRGTLLPEIPLPFELPVTVQLHNSDTGACLSSELPEARANDPDTFTAIKTQ